jgi:hypothetical protein
VGGSALGGASVGASVGPTVAVGATGVAMLGIGDVVEAAGVVMPRLGAVDGATDGALTDTQPVRIVAMTAATANALVNFYSL